MDSKDVTNITQWSINAGDGNHPPATVNYGYTGGFFSNSGAPTPYNIKVVFDGGGQATDAIQVTGARDSSGNLITFDSIVDDLGGNALTFTKGTSSDVVSYGGVGTVDLTTATDTDPATPGTIPEPGAMTTNSLEFKMPSTGTNDVSITSGGATGVSQVIGSSVTTTSLSLHRRLRCSSSAAVRPARRRTS